MPQSISILNIPEMVIKKIGGINPVNIYAEYRAQVYCPNCQSKNVRTKKTFSRKIRHESIGDRSSPSIAKVFLLLLYKPALMDGY